MSSLSLLAEAVLHFAEKEIVNSVPELSGIAEQEIELLITKLENLLASKLKLHMAPVQ